LFVGVIFYERRLDFWRSCHPGCGFCRFQLGKSSEGLSVSRGDVLGGRQYIVEMGVLSGRLA
jgi:hypothetical protein